MSRPYAGSCLCEQIRYEFEGSFESFFLCHCKYCQKDTGSAHAANLFSTTGKLRWLAGEVKIKTFNLPTTRHTKSFCADCGAAVPNLQMEGKLWVIPAGSLNTPITKVPDGHLFCSSRASWDQNLEGVRKFETFPS